MCIWCDVFFLWISDLPLNWSEPWAHNTNFLNSCVCVCVFTLWLTTYTLGNAQWENLTDSNEHPLKSFYGSADCCRCLGYWKRHGLARKGHCIFSFCEPRVTINGIKSYESDEIRSWNTVPWENMIKFCFSENTDCYSLPTHTDTKSHEICLFSPIY